MDKKHHQIKTEKTSRKAGNPIIFGFALGMLILGIVMIFDASVYLANQPPFNDPYYFLKLHLIWLLLGGIGAFIIYMWDYRKIVKLALPLLIINIVLLVAVLIVGTAINGSKRWFSLGPLPIQPAEFIKPVFIIYISSWLAKERRTYKNFNDALRFGFKQKLVGFGATLLLVLLLILLEPDLGTTLIVGATAFAIFFISGTDLAHTVGSFLISIVLALLGILAAIIAPYRLDRVKTFLTLLTTGVVENADKEGYQVQQILIGIGSASWKGVGFGQSRQRFGYLVENTAFTDSIFAVFVEEMGIIGALFLIGAWLIFLYAGMQVAKNAPDRQGRYIALGITIWLTLQAFLNMAANVGLIPLTGIPLPFLTYGGSNTIVTLAGMALLLNISRYSTSQNGRKNIK